MGSKKIECHNCGSIQDPTPPIRKNEDMEGIFKCSECDQEYKIDMVHYFEFRDQEDFIASTFRPDLDPNKDYVKELDKLGNKILKDYKKARGIEDNIFTKAIYWLKKEWIYIVGGLLIYYFFFR